MKILLFPAFLLLPFLSRSQVSYRNYAFNKEGEQRVDKTVRIQLQDSAVLFYSRREEPFLIELAVKLSEVAGKTLYDGIDRQGHHCLVQTCYEGKRLLWITVGDGETVLVLEMARVEEI